MSDYTAEEIVRLNSHELTAHQLVTTRRELGEEYERHGRAIEELLADLSKAQQVGIRVFKARQAGRKTIRIEDLFADGFR